MKDGPEFSPLPPDAPKEDRISTAFLAMGSAAAAAVAWFSVLTLIQTRLIAGSTVQTVAQIDPHAPDVNFMVYGTLLGVAFAFVVAWTQMSGIPSSYRRGGLSLVAAFAGSVLAGMLTYVARSAVGASALAGLAIVFITIAIWMARRAALSAR